MLSVQVYTDHTRGTLLADLSRQIALPDGGGVVFGTSQHGFAECDLPFVPMTQTQAFEVYNWPGLPHLVVSDEGGAAVWEGRVERVGVVSGGATITAYGYWRALSDLYYTSIWSDSETAGWRPVAVEDSTAYNSKQFQIDNNNRLFVGLEKNAVYAANRMGGLLYYAPSASSEDIAQVSLTYSLNLATGWTLRLRSHTAAFAASTTEWSIAGNGSTQTGTVYPTITAGRYLLTMEVINTSGGNITYSGETGDQHARFTAVRVKGKTGTVLASDIAAALVGYVNSSNSSQLSSSTAGIATSTLDMNTAVYEDVYPADILDELATQNQYTAAVWTGRQLSFAALGAVGNTYYIDAAGLELVRDIGEMANTVYAVYQAKDGRTLRSSSNTNATSLSQFGAYRQAVANVRTTDLAEAQSVRDAVLAQRATYALQATVQFDRMYTAAGGIVPVYRLRAGDTLVVRNLPPSVAGLDNVRSFRLARTRYTAGGGGESIDVEPESPVPTLVTLVAGR